MSHGQGSSGASNSVEALEALIRQLYHDICAQDNWGKAAQYIPELAKVNPAQFGLSICLPQGSVIHVGDAHVPFSIQSVSKVFTLALALQNRSDQLWARVGQEPSGNAFNSIVQLEVEKGKPRNPFINAGAMVTTDVILTHDPPEETVNNVLQYIRTAASDSRIHVNKKLAESEYATGHRNYSLAHFLRSHNNLTHHPEQTLWTYFQHCAIEMTCVQLAKAGRFLARIQAQETLLSKEHVHAINALMMTCGHYNGSGEFACRVGLPGKSGVGGGILAIVPGIASIAVWSPGLNQYGNSLQGTYALERLSKATGWSVFTNPTPYIQSESSL